MKTLLFLFLSLTAVAQCDTNNISSAYYSIPSFITLFVNNECISVPIMDTTICTQVELTNQPQLAAFSYSTPNGTSPVITDIKQYDDNCVYITDGTQIMQGEGVINICYTISGGLIDNFCPYTIFMGGLSVDFCGIYAYYTDNLHVRFLTCSNSGTLYYEILQSNDAITWRSLSKFEPFFETSSQEHDYNLTLCYHNEGINYFCIRETDINGNTTTSEIVYCNISPKSKNSDVLNYDLSGRLISGNKNFTIVK
jgi:hypothetical protein